MWSNYTEYVSLMDFKDRNLYSIGNEKWDDQKWKLQKVLSASSKKTSLRKKVMGLGSSVYPLNTVCECLNVSLIELSAIET